VRTTRRRAERKPAGASAGRQRPARHSFRPDGTATKFAQWCGTERTADWHLRFDTQAGSLPSCGKHYRSHQEPVISKPVPIQLG
jgi:hypothetical protein